MLLLLMLLLLILYDACRFFAVLMERLVIMVCMYACMHVCMYECMHVCMFVLRLSFGAPPCTVQVDPEWRARKLALAPTADALDAFAPHDPIVWLKLTTNATTPAPAHGCGSGGLKCDSSSGAAAAAFSLDVSMSDVFGEMSAEAEWKCDQALHTNSSMRWFM
jgi:hypothetical protein